MVTLPFVHMFAVALLSCGRSPSGGGVSRAMQHLFAANNA
jgi:hypothetical protein